MAAEKKAPAKAPVNKPEEKTDYTRAGGHVLTDMGWMPEELVERSGAKKTEIKE